MGLAISITWRPNQLWGVGGVDLYGLVHRKKWVYFCICTNDLQGPYLGMSYFTSPLNYHLIIFQEFFISYKCSKELYLNLVLFDVGFYDVQYLLHGGSLMMFLKLYWRGLLLDEIFEIRTKNVFLPLNIYISVHLFYIIVSYFLFGVKHKYWSRKLYLRKKNSIPF